MPDIDNYKIIKRSVTKDDYADTPYGGGVIRLYVPINTTSKFILPPLIPDYWSMERDRVLRSTVHAEPMWAGAVGIAVTKIASMSWQIESEIGLRQRRAQELFLNAGGENIGWVQFLSKHLRDFLTTDNGAFIEIVRATRAMGSRIIGLRHLNSQRCVRTGDPDIPVLYYDRKGRAHEMRDYQIMALSDMPDPSDEYYGVGLCAASRAYQHIFKLCVIEWYVREKVSGLSPLGIYIVNGVLDKQIRDAVETTVSDKKAQGVVSYMGATIIGSPSENPVNMVTIPLAELPDRFNRKEEFDIAILAYANALGVDVQDLQPIASGSLGTGAQSQVLHEKALGKGLTAWKQSFTHLVNQYVLDDLTTFMFVEKDIRDTAAKAGVSSTLASVASTRINSKITTPAQELRWLIEQDELPREYLPETDKLINGSLSDDEKPESGENDGDLSADVSTTFEDVTGNTDTKPDINNVTTLPTPEKTDAQIQSEQNEIRRGTMSNINDSKKTEENDKRQSESSEDEFKKKVELLKIQANLKKDKELFRDNIKNRIDEKIVSVNKGHLDIAEDMVTEFAQNNTQAKLTAKVRRFNQEMPEDLKKISQKAASGIIQSLKGGPGSGNFGHAGRPGKVGGSAGENMATVSTVDTVDTSGKLYLSVERESKFDNEKWTSIEDVGERIKQFSELSLEEQDAQADAVHSIKKYQEEVLGFIGKRPDTGDVLADIQKRVAQSKGLIHEDSQVKIEDTVIGLESILDTMGVSSKERHALCMEAVDSLLAQESESCSRQLGDHGINHIMGDIETALMALKTNPQGDTAEQMASVYISGIFHDAGYLTEPSRAFIDSGHPRWSMQHYDENIRPMVENILGKRSAGDISHIIRTHADSSIDWAQDPTGTAVRIADNLALFQKEKAPALFRLAPENVDVLESLARGKIDLAKARSEMKKNIQSKGFPKKLTESLFKATDEVGPRTAKFTLGMFAGNFDSMEWAKDHLKIYLRGNSKVRKLQDIADLGRAQLLKFGKSYNVSPEDMADGNWSISDDSNQVLLETQVVGEKEAKEKFDKFLSEIVLEHMADSSQTSPDFFRHLGQAGQTEAGNTPASAQET